MASSAMGLIRGMVGFLTFFLLFELRDDPTWHMGVVLVVTGAGSLVGSTLAPVLRRSLTEERMLTAALGAALGMGLLMAWLGGLVAAALMAATVAIVSTGRSEEHTSELQSLMRISYAVFCLKKKKKNNNK